MGGTDGILMRTGGIGNYLSFWMIADHWQLQLPYVQIPLRDETRAWTCSYRKPSPCLRARLGHNHSRGYNIPQGLSLRVASFPFVERR
jgi:hypothetical protein